MPKLSIEEIGRMHTDEDFYRKSLGCMALSFVTPLTFTITQDQNVNVFLGTKPVGVMPLAVFARLEPTEILKTLGLPMRDSPRDV